MFNFQDINSINEFIKRQVKKYPKISLVTLYRRARNLRRTHSIGDIIIMMHIKRYLTSNYFRRFRRGQLRRLINTSKELKQESKKMKAELIKNLKERGI